MKRAVFRFEAVRDLNEIADFIARDDPVRAESFVAELEKRAKDAGKSPHLYRIRVRSRGDVRAIAHRRYRIYFREHDDHILILRVLHTARNPGPLTE